MSSRSTDVMGHAPRRVRAERRTMRRRRHPEKVTARARTTRGGRRRRGRRGIPILKSMSELHVVETIDAAERARVEWAGGHVAPGHVVASGYVPIHDVV